MIDKKNFNHENSNSDNSDQHQLTLFAQEVSNSRDSDLSKNQKTLSTSQQVSQDMKNSADLSNDQAQSNEFLNDQETSLKSNSDNLDKIIKSEVYEVSKNDLNNPQNKFSNPENSKEKILEINNSDLNKSDSILKTEVNFKKAKDEALKILERFGFDSPPVDPIVVAHELGINVRFVKFNPENKKISGFFYAKRNEIFVNEEEDIYRQVFTIAHELGHKLLHEEWLKTNDYQVLWRDASLYDTDDAKEKEANCFAANLLVPKAMLKQYYQVANVEELSVLFGVSRQVITFRLKNEGFVTSRRLYE
jgi:Zn-dependent peptidase ImmA (M78 family)